MDFFTRMLDWLRGSFHMQRARLRAQRAPRPVKVRTIAPATPTPSPIFQHRPHPYRPRNVNDVHKAERTGFNQKIAVFLTAYVGTMQTAYGFAALAIIGLLGVLAILNPSVYTLIAWLSQTFIQLVLLPVIMVGQNVLNRHAELQADEMFATTQRTYHDLCQAQEHLNAQDQHIIALEEINCQQLALLQTQGAQIAAMLAKLTANVPVAQPSRASTPAAAQAAPSD